MNQLRNWASLSRWVYASKRIDTWVGSETYKNVAIGYLYIYRIFNDMGVMLSDDWMIMGNESEKTCWEAVVT